MPDKRMAGIYSALNSFSCGQVVETRLFTGSHDGTIKVWDIAGLKDDSTFGLEGTDEVDEETKVTNL